MSLFDKLFALIEAGDDQANNPYAWATNQAGHAALVGWPMALLVVWAGLAPWAAPLAVAAAYGAVWEWLIQRGKDWRDSLMDSACVMCGAGLFSAPHYGLWTCFGVGAIFGAVILFGVWRRL